jgi:hypothetical protein
MEAPYRNDYIQGLVHIHKIYSLFKSECLSIDIRLTLYKALIRSIMVYACPT